MLNVHLNNVLENVLIFKYELFFTVAGIALIK